MFTGPSPLLRSRGSGSAELQSDRSDSNLGGSPRLPETAGLTLDKPGIQATRFS
jgi:hypothetical protein